MSKDERIFDLITIKVKKNQSNIPYDKCKYNCPLYHLGRLTSQLATVERDTKYKVRYCKQKTILYVKQDEKTLLLKRGFYCA